MSVMTAGGADKTRDTRIKTAKNTSKTRLQRNREFDSDKMRSFAVVCLLFALGE